MNPQTSHTAGEAFEAFAGRKEFLRRFSVGKYTSLKRQQEHQLGLEETGLKLYTQIREETDNSRHNSNNNNHRFEAKNQSIIS